MRTILCSLVIMFSVLQVFAQDQKDYHKNIQNLKGKIKSMVEKSFYASENEGKILKKGLIYQDSLSYNEGGFLLEMKHSNSNNLLWRDVNKFDENGNRIEEHRYGGEGDLVYKNIYQYDTFGNQIQKIAYNYQEKLQFKIDNAYDKNGNLLTTNKIMPGGQKKTIKKNIYDDKGFLVEETMYDLTERPMMIINKYDDYGNKIVTELYSEKKKFIEKETFKYDKNGKLIEKVFYDSPNNFSRKIVYIYNNRGDMVEKSHYQKNGELLERDTYEFKYDIFENFIEEKHFKYYLGAKETNESSKYFNFDEYGNWREKLFYKDGKLHSIIEREIEYHL